MRVSSVITPTDRVSASGRVSVKAVNALAQTSEGVTVHLATRPQANLAARTVDRANASDDAMNQYLALERTQAGVRRAIANANVDAGITQMQAMSETIGRILAMHEPGASQTPLQASKPDFAARVAEDASRQRMQLERQSGSLDDRMAALTASRITALVVEAMREQEKAMLEKSSKSLPTA